MAPLPPASFRPLEPRAQSRQAGLAQKQTSPSDFEYLYFLAPTNYQVPYKGVFTGGKEILVGQRGPTTESKRAKGDLWRDAQTNRIKVPYKATRNPFDLKPGWNTENEPATHDHALRTWQRATMQEILC